MFNWNDLRAFLAVARGGSTLAASRALDVNQTTVARRLEALEQALGFKLVERGQTGSRLTEAGRDLLGEAEAVERAAEALAVRAAAQKRGTAGVIRLTANELLSNMILTPGMAAFRQAHPDVQLDLMVTDRMLDIEGGEADVAIRASEELPASDLIARKLADFDFALYVSADYAARRSRPAGAGDLAAHDLIGDGGAEGSVPGVRWMLEQAPGAAPVSRSNTITNMLQAVRAGLGVGPLPCLVADIDPSLIRATDEIAAVRASAWIVTRRALKDAPRVRAFIDFIAPFFAATIRDLAAQGRAVRDRRAEEAGAGAPGVSPPA